jgi:hypothetical protein
MRSATTAGKRRNTNPRCRYRLAGTFPRHDKNFMRRITRDAADGVAAAWLPG